MKLVVTVKDVEVLSKQTHYERLSVTAEADSLAIKRAYRLACRRFHPDKAREEDLERATQCMQMVTGAHAVLSDPMKRAAYDRWLEHGAEAGEEFNENDDGGIPWSEEGGFFGLIVNIALATALAGVVSFLFAQQVLQLSYGRVPALILNCLRCLVSPLGLPSRAVTWVPSLRVTVVGLFVLWLVGVGETPGEYLVDIRSVLGAAAVRIMMQSLHGMADPHRDSPLEDQVHWWDTTLSSALFSYWFWVGGGALVPAIVWSYFVAFAISTVIERWLRYDENEMEAAFGLLRKQPAKTVAFCSVGVFVIWTVLWIQYAYWTRVLVGIALVLILGWLMQQLGKPLTDDQREHVWRNVQEWGVAGWLFCYHGVGIVWSAIGWVVYMNLAAHSVVEMSPRGTVHVVLLLVVVWPLLQWAVYSGVDWLLHGEWVQTCLVGLVVSVGWPIVRRMLAGGMDMMKAGLDEDEPATERADEPSTSATTVDDNEEEDEAEAETKQYSSQRRRPFQSPDPTRYAPDPDD
eukprot:m.48914 g.48914  ORF g.48914 m.48914 type:complete len:517 (-) comp7053_c0_seq1:169-1719(-)